MKMLQAIRFSGVFLFLSFMVTAAYAQCKYAMNETDEFTGNTKKKLAQVNIGKGVYASLARVDSTHFLTLFSDMGCATRKSYFMIKFTDQSVIELKHFGEIDCGDMVAFVTPLLSGTIDELLSKTIDKVRISGDKGYTDFALKDPEYFKKGLACLK